MRTIALPLLLGATIASAEPLPGTRALDWEGDIASRLVDAADGFLLDRIDAALAGERLALETPMARMFQVRSVSASAWQ